MNKDEQADDRTLQISVRGLPEDEARDLGEAVNIAVSGFRSNLDLRRLVRVIVTDDFASAIAELSIASDQKITYTQEEYASAGAKIVHLPTGDDFEIAIVFSLLMVGDLILKEETPEARERVLTAIHSLHHELCHVHDTNKRIDALPMLAGSMSFRGAQVVLFPLAEWCWSEYFANYLSSGTATATAIRQQSELFLDALNRAEPTIREEILAFRLHADLNKLMELFRRHGEWLPKAAAYLIGFVQGTNRSLADLSPESAKDLSNSYFEETWNEMGDALAQMREGYPNQWAEDLAVYDRLTRAMGSYYEKMGIILSTGDNGQCRVNIGFEDATRLSAYSSYERD